MTGVLMSKHGLTRDDRPGGKDLSRLTDPPPDLGPESSRNSSLNLVALGRAHALTLLSLCDSRDAVLTQ